MQSAQIQQNLPFKVHKNYRQETALPNKRKRVHKVYQHIKPTIQTRRQQHLRLKKQRSERRKRQKEDKLLNTMISLVQVDSQSVSKEDNKYIDLLAYEAMNYENSDKQIQKEEQIALSQSKNFIEDSEEYPWPGINS